MRFITFGMYKFSSKSTLSATDPNRKKIASASCHMKKIYYISILITVLYIFVKTYVNDLNALYPISIEIILTEK